MVYRACLIILTALVSMAVTSLAAAAAKPNIVLILGDDVGYGDLSCYGATRIRTPALDRLAREGVRFTDAHSSASVCTPTRYSLLTGQYAFRSPAGSRILSGVAPLSIRPGSATLPGLLKGAGYATGIVGKWHLGLGERENGQDWNGAIKPGPREVGFDYAFIIPATGDRVPCVYVEDGRVVGLDPKDPIAVSYGKRIGNEPTGEDPQGIEIKLPANPGHDHSIVNGIGRIGYMTGGHKARWIDESIPHVLTSKARRFIEAHRGEPFFLYYAAHDIHAPRVANANFTGSSEAGVRGDVVQQLDWQAGEILAALDRSGLADNTLVIFSSDNGGTMQNGYREGERADLNGHAINGRLRGQKGSLWEGGTRVPFIARWPGKIKAGSSSRELLALVDMTATLAAAAGGDLPAGTAPDSFDMLPALLGKAASRPIRNSLVLQGNGSQAVALRQGSWKYIPGNPGPGKKKKAGNAEQLYQLATDLSESRNLAPENPEKAKAMRTLLQKLRDTTQTRP